MFKVASTNTQRRKDRGALPLERANPMLKKERVRAEKAAKKAAKRGTRGSLKDNWDDFR